MIVNKIYYSLIYILSFLPYRFNGYIHKFYTYILEKVILYRKKTIRHNLSQAFPTAGIEKINAITHDCYLNLTAYVVETLKLFFKPTSYFKERIHFVNPQLLDEIAAEKPIIVISSHYGNWEWAAVLLPLFIKTPASAIYKPLSDTHMDALIKQLRGRFGLGLISINEVVRKVSTEKVSHIYLFVADQSPAASRSGELVKFMGIDTLFYAGAEILAKKNHFAVVYQKISRENGKYKIVFERIDPEGATHTYASRLENELTSDPGPWLWSHRRWKHKKPVS
ncbi:MAG: lysophospholipid acyltransferase family protein [Saprospiraceae bacterium]|nr:lysophospholipid acyltransferase family protein [Saprospiraceae bacterium]